MKKLAATLFLTIFAAVGVFGQAPTLTIVTETPNLPSELWYGPPPNGIKVKPVRLRPSGADVSKCGPSCGTNTPITIADYDFFIQQQYIDFLRRFPEPSCPQNLPALCGLDFYLPILNGCNSADTECIKYTRGALSANFFRSPEFQAKGNLVMFLYMITIGQRAMTVAELSDPSKVERPHYAEFMTDVASITNPADRNGPDPTLKAAFLAAWVQRPEFIAVCPVGVSNGQCALNLGTKAGVTLSSSTLSAVAAAPSRAEVARIVAESSEVGAKFYKPAFVTMEYFGYLRRDPEDCHNPANWFGTPDGSGCGYIFHNNRFLLPGNPDFIENTIVRGFIESPEYFARF